MTKLLWQPSQERIKSTNMYSFMNLINEKYNQHFSEYAPLYQWSIENIPDFWASMWKFAEIKASKPYDQVVDDVGKMPGASWFSGSRLNFAENLLRYRDNRTAFIFKGEDRVSYTMTYSELYDEVARVAMSLRAAGVQVGDRVVGFMPNMPETIIAMLAAHQHRSNLVFLLTRFRDKGCARSIRPDSAQGHIHGRWVLFQGGNVLTALNVSTNIIKKLPSIEKLVVVPYTEKNPDIIMTAQCNSLSKISKSSRIRIWKLNSNNSLLIIRFYVMYSSGTTGLPKCMVQSAGGILIHHLKELMLHADLNKRGYHLLLYHLRLDDVELACQLFSCRCNTGSV